MKKTKLIGIIIWILIIAFIVILFFIANLTILKPQKGGDTNNNTEINDENTNSKNISNTTNENIVSSDKIENTTTTNNTNDVFYNTEETGTARYSQDQLNNFSFELKGLTDDNLKYINNIDNFNLSLKEYIYKHGLVDATIGEVQKSEYQESTNRLGIIIKLNNPKEDKLRVIISSGDKIDISNYK